MEFELGVGWMKVEVCSVCERWGIAWDSEHWREDMVTMNQRC